MSAEEFENPWEKVSTRVVYGNPWIRVREDEVARPDGMVNSGEITDALSVLAIQQSLLRQRLA